MVPVRRMIATLLFVSGGGYLALCLLLFLMQRSMLYFPTPARGGGEVEEFESDGVRLAVSVRRLVGPKALLYFGGNAEDVSLSLPELGEAFPDRALFLPHYRGYGGSGGRPTETALHADARALFDRIHAAHPDIVVVGRSLGSAIAVRLATERPVGRLVLVTPMDSILRTAQRHFPFLPVAWLLRDRYESWRLAERVTAPTHLIVAERDEIVPRAAAESLLARFPPGVATLSVLPGADHNFDPGDPDFLHLLRAAR
jgi:pimeloyl-ACP methyl ester carboxylesterase